MTYYSMPWCVAFFVTTLPSCHITPSALDPRFAHYPSVLIAVYPVIVVLYGTTAVEYYDTVLTSSKLVLMCLVPV